MAIPKKKGGQKGKGKKGLKKEFNSKRASVPQPSEDELGNFVDGSRDGDVGLIADFLDKYPTCINKQDRYGDLALAEAAAGGQLAVVQLLLKRGALPDTKNRRGDTALTLAAYEGHCDVIEALLNGQAKINLSDREGETPVMRTVEGGQKAALALLLSHKAQVDASDKEGNTALMKAAGNGHIEIMRILLEHGASLRKKNRDGETAADCADYRGEPEAVQFLKEWHEIAAAMQQAKEMRQKEQEEEKGLRKHRDAFIEKLKNNKEKGQRVILKKTPPKPQ